MGPWRFTENHKCSKTLVEWLSEEWMHEVNNFALYAIMLLCISCHYKQCFLSKSIHGTCLGSRQGKLMCATWGGKMLRRDTMAWLPSQWEVNKASYILKGRNLGEIWQVRQVVTEWRNSQSFTQQWLLEKSTVNLEIKAKCQWREK